MCAHIFLAVLITFPFLRPVNKHFYVNVPNNFFCPYCQMGIGHNNNNNFHFNMHVMKEGGLFKIGKLLKRLVYASNNNK